MLSIISLSAAVLLLSSLSEQSSYPGQCSNFAIPAVQPFYPVKIGAKIWYLIATDDDGLPYHAYDCIRFFHFVAIGTRYVKTTEYAKNLTTKKSETTTSAMVFPGFDGNYTYKTAGSPDQATNIVLTDYLTYYVEISCADEGGEAKLYVGIFSTLRKLSPFTLDVIYKFLEGHQIQTSKLRFVDQSITSCA